VIPFSCVATEGNTFAGPRTRHVFKILFGSLPIPFSATDVVWQASPERVIYLGAEASVALQPVKMFDENFVEEIDVSSGQERRKPAESIVAQLFRTHAHKVRHLLAYKLRSPEDAQDATQDVFLKLVRREHTGALREQATAYMHSAARTVAIDTERRRHADTLHQHDDVEEREPAAQVSSHDEALHWRQAVTLLVQCLQDLPERAQQVFVLYHFEGLSHVEITMRLNVSLRSVERHMARAMAHCKSRLGDYL
jgi:RNA polymerase sigma-70 factor (ECF subfamily)